MTLMSQTASLVRREILLEQRQKYALFGVLLYVVSTVFVSKFSFHSVKDVAAWNSLFWVILLFASVTGVARSFAQESKGRLLYLYTIADPRAVFLAKLIYNSLLMIVLGIAGLAIYAFLIGYPVKNSTLFLLSLILGCSALASAFTMISAIASRAGNNFALMAILGFPTVLPVVMCAIRVSLFAIKGYSLNGEALNYLGVLVALNVTVVALSYLLFPYLWRD